MTVTQLAPNPSVESDLTGIANFPAGNAAAWWRDTASHHTTSGPTGSASIRVNNSSAQSNGVVWASISLASGTYATAVWAQVLASTTNAAFVVRASGTTSPLVEFHWNSPNNSWTRSNGDGFSSGKQAGVGFFSISSTTTIEFCVGVGIYGAASAGSARFDELYIERVGAAGMSTGSLVVNDYFDGNTPSTASTTYAWTGTANLSTSTATPVGGGSYQSWALIYADDFASGSAPDATHWYRQDGYKGTNGNGNRVGTLDVVTGGNLEIRTNGDNIGGVNSQDSFTYGKVVVWAKKDSRPGYSPVLFLWPANDIWAGGELDLWEGDSNTHITSFMHNAVGNPSAQIGPTTTNLDTTAFHKYSIEWLPNSVTYLVDDVVIWTNTNATYIPTTAMRLILQTEVKLPGGTGTASGTVRPSYPTAYSPPWVFTIDRVEIYSASTSADHNVYGQAIESTPVVGPGSAGQVIDTATAEATHYAKAFEQRATDLDTANGRVPGQLSDTGGGTPAPPVVQLDNERWYLITSTGESIELTRYVNDAELLRGMSGRGAPPARPTRILRAGQPGDYTTYTNHGPRVMKVPLRVVADDFESLLAVQYQLTRASNILNGHVRLRREDRNGNTFDLYCEIDAGMEIEGEGTYGIVTHVLPLQIHANDPYWYGQTTTHSFSGGSGASWFPMLPVSLGSSAILGDATITTGSDVPTEPIWTVVGPGGGLVLAQYTTTPTQTLELSTALDPGDVVVIDTHVGAKTVMKGGVSLFGDLTAHDFWSLEPGINTIRADIAEATSDSYVAVSWRDKKLMPLL